MIIYQSFVKGISEKHLHGFFVGWRKKPSTKTHLRLLKNSDYVVLARDSKTKNVVGFVSAISDGVLSSYIPFLEVLPGYQNRGIGVKLMKTILSKLNRFYIVDLFCDKDMRPYYRKFGMRPDTAMIIRNKKRQSGK